MLFPWNHHNGPCFLIGLDKQTGEIAWKKDRPIGTAHATPLLVEHHGQKDILVPGQNRLTAFDARTHAELWRYGEGEGPYNGEIISSPVYGDGMVFLQLWRQSKIHAIRLDRRRQATRADLGQPEAGPGGALAALLSRPAVRPHGQRRSRLSGRQDRERNTTANDWAATATRRPSPATAAST